MNSEKAANVRDAINGLPCVAHDPEVSPNYPSDGNTTVTRGNEKWTHTGDCVHIAGRRGYAFSPAKINEAGQIAFDGGPLRPCYEVTLQPLAVPTRPLPSVSLPPAIVHEVAKYDCRIRVLSGYRGEYTPGLIRIRDDLAHDQDPDADGDRCPNCRATRFKMQNGIPECARCGTQVEETRTTDDVTLQTFT